MKNPFQSPDGRSGDSEHRSYLAFATMLTGIVLVTTLGPTVVDGLSSQLDQPEVESLAAPPDTTAPSPVTAQSAVPGTDDSTSTTAGPDRTVPVTSPTPTTVTPTTTDQTTTTVPAEANTPLRTIQLVPALRDVIVDIDGRELVSDANGVIQIGDVPRDADFTFVGVRATPSLRDVAFEQWADGSPEAERSLGEIDGPSTRIGIVLSHRVSLTTGGDVPDGSEVEFESQAGTVRLAVDRSAWVPAARAVESPDGLVTQQLSYDADALVVGDDETPIEDQTFGATPEALWTVDTDA